MKNFLFVLALAGVLLSSCEKVEEQDSFNPNSEAKIKFEDNIVKIALLEYPGVDMNGDKEISYKEASEVKTLAGCFDNYRERIYSFDELQYFTELQTIEKLFYKCTNLQSVTLPEISEISRSAFYECKSLKALVLPKSVTAIREYSFYYCSSLKEVKIPDSVTIIEDAAFCYSSITQMIIPASVKELKYQAFSACKYLQSVQILASLEYIANELFNDCSLNEITIPNSVKWIGWNAFKANQFVSVTIPSGVESITSNVFFDCDKLKTINISETVESLGSGVFSDCNSLESIYLRGANPPYFIGGTPGINQNVSIYVPRNAVNIYKTNVDWVMYANQIVGHDY